MREAQHWVVVLHSGEVTEAETAAFEVWRGQSPAHERAHSDASRQWALFREAALNLASQGYRYDPQPIIRAHRLQRRAILGSGGTALMAAGYVIARPPLDLWPSLTQLTADYRTATGQTRQLSLASTVSVEMNTQTSLSIRQGEAGVSSFDVLTGEVAVEATTPTVVVAGSGQARVVQGGFDLRNEDGTVTVTCAQGEVRVACGETDAVLQPGQRIAYDGKGLGGIFTVKMATVEAWRHGLLVFEETPLARVVSELNRYRPGRIILMNGSLAALPVDATFRLDHLDQAIPKLEDVYGIKVRSLPGGVVLLG